MLPLHGFLVFALLELQLSELLLGDPELVAQLPYLLVVVSVLVQLDQSLFLFLLDPEQGFRLILECLQNAFFVFLLIFKGNYLLNIVGAFELAAHVFYLPLVMLRLSLGLLQFGLFHQDLFVLLRKFVAGNPKHLLMLALSRLLNEIFKFTSQHLELSLQLVVLGAELGDDDLLFVAFDSVFVQGPITVAFGFLDSSPLDLPLYYRNQAPIVAMGTVVVRKRSLLHLLLHFYPVLLGHSVP